MFYEHSLIPVNKKKLALDDTPSGQLSSAASNSSHLVLSAVGPSSNTATTRGQSPVSSGQTSSSLLGSDSSDIVISGKHIENI